MGDSIYPIIIAIVCLLGIIFDIIGLAGIKWGYTNNASHALYVICLIFFIFGLCMALLFIYFYCQNAINARTRGVLQLAVILAIIVALIGLIFNIIALAVSVKKFNDLRKEARSVGIDLVTKKEKRLMVAMMVLTLILFIIEIPLWILVFISLNKYTYPPDNPPVPKDNVNYGTREINL